MCRRFIRIFQPEPKGELYLVHKGNVHYLGVFEVRRLKIPDFTVTTVFVDDTAETYDSAFHLDVDLYFVVVVYAA